MIPENPCVIENYHIHSARYGPISQAFVVAFGVSAKIRVMSMKNRKILLGVTGGIAAYKAAELTRLLIKQGADVRVVMTPGAEAFVTPMTFQALSGNAVRTELFDAEHEAAMGHIELARWAEQVLIAPASANFLAKLGQGLADGLLSTLCLATAAPVAIAPAMNQQMWHNAATRSNLNLLTDRDIQIIGPASGDQACGETGAGRMEEPAEIVAAMLLDSEYQPLAGKRVLITAGPTREPFDPVRFLSNRSSGKMGFAIADAAVRAGAEVILVAGPVALPDLYLVNRINVETAQQMHTAVIKHLTGVDVFIATAAVSDYRPETVATQKIKKQKSTLAVTLIRNPDILADVAKQATPPFCVGFAAETDRLKDHALAKLEQKQLDMIAANPVNDGLGFDHDENSLRVFWQGGEKAFPVASKRVLGRDLITLIAERLEAKTDAPN